MSPGKNYSRRRPPPKKKGCCAGRAALSMGLIALAVLALASCMPPIVPPLPGPDAKTSVVYDSLVMQVQDEVAAAHPDWEMIGFMGYQMSDVMDDVNERRDAGTLKEVVFALMVNDSRPAGLTWLDPKADGWSTADQNLWASVVLNLHEATHVVLVKPYLAPGADPRWYPEIDKARAYCDFLQSIRPDSITVVDWADYASQTGEPGGEPIPNVIAEDDIHLATNTPDAMDPTDEAIAARLAVLEAGVM